MNEDLLSPLNADPSRQAIPSLRGYVYQVARTALAWLELPEGEMIQVEGAEDFDRVGRTEGVATQVKALRNNITLRNSDVSEAIQNFWILRRDNPGRHLAFRFLTTARPGHEDGDPFGMPGIVFWNGLLREADPAMRRAGANRLRLFLADRQAFSAEFRAYLRDVDTDDFFENLVAPLHFETDL